MNRSRLTRLAVLTFVLVGALATAPSSDAQDYSAIPVDDSLLSAAQPLSAQPPTHSIRRYEMLPQEVDRRFVCFNPAANLKIVVEVAHTNDLAHSATVQLINPVGVVEASFLTIATRLPRYPDVGLDSYKIRFGAELSTLVVSARRTNRLSSNELVSGMLQSDRRIELVACNDELLDSGSLKALDAPFASNLNEVLIPSDKHPKSMCAITTIANDKAKYICSAVLIAPNLALTANHCLAKLKDQTAQLNCGEAEAAVINVKESVSNPLHDKEQWKVSSDIAILKLDSNISIPAAVLATTPSEGADLLFTQTDACGAYGYGNQFDGRGGILHGVKFAPPPEDLGGLALTLENYQFERLITSDPRYFLRPGDSGGGVICQRGNEEVVVGIHSFSYPIDSTVNSASVGHNYEWLVEQINLINGVTISEPPNTLSQDPNLLDQSVQNQSEIL